jgi:hypothetical protein
MYLYLFVKGGLSLYRFMRPFLDAPLQPVAALS